MAIEGHKFPRHISLSLDHNRHELFRSSVQEWMEDDGIAAEDFVSAEQLAKAVATNECWGLTWFPETPVGSRRLFAADLDVLLAAAGA